eukprot:6982331-Prymnesium_polylepis.1
MLVAISGLVARWHDDRSGPRWHRGFGSPWAPTAARSPLRLRLNSTVPRQPWPLPTSTAP